MTTDLNLLYQQLDLNPGDRTLLMAIADEELEIGSGLGMGLKALANCNRVPWYWKGSMDWGWWKPSWKTTDTELGLLTTDWWDLVATCNVQCDNKSWDGTPTAGASIAYREAAKAFNLLPLERQQQLLEGKL